MHFIERPERPANEASAGQRTNLSVRETLQLAKQPLLQRFQAGFNPLNRGLSSCHKRSMGLSSGLAAGWNTGRTLLGHCSWVAM